MGYEVKLQACKKCISALAEGHFANRHFLTGRQNFRKQANEKVKERGKEMEKEERRRIEEKEEEWRNRKIKIRGGKDEKKYGFVS